MQEDVVGEITGADEVLSLSHYVTPFTGGKGSGSARLLLTFLRGS